MALDLRAVIAAVPRDPVDQQLAIMLHQRALDLLDEADNIAPAAGLFGGPRLRQGARDRLRASIEGATGPYSHADLVFWLSEAVAEWNAADEGRGHRSAIAEQLALDLRQGLADVPGQIVAVAGEVLGFHPGWIVGGAVAAIILAAAAARR